MIQTCAPSWPCILLDGQLAVAQLNPAARQLLVANEAQLCLRQQRLRQRVGPAQLHQQPGAGAMGTA